MRQIFSVKFVHQESIARNEWLDETAFTNEPINRIQTGGLDIDVDITDVTLDAVSSLGYDSIKDTTRGMLSRTPNTDMITTAEILTQGNREWDILHIAKDDHTITLILRENTNASP